MKKFILMVISVCCMLFCMTSCSKEPVLNQEGVDISDAIVRVNDYYILASAIDPVYEEYKDTGISRNKIINDSILEILVVQESPKYDISLSDKELDQIVEAFKSSQSEIYMDSVAQYGEQVLKEKLRIRNLFSKTKEHVMENIILKDGISHADIERFTVKYGLEEQFAPYSDEQIIHNLQKELEEFLFNEWMENLKNGANITYLK